MEKAQRRAECATTPALPSTLGLAHRIGNIRNGGTLFSVHNCRITRDRFFMVPVGPEQPQILAISQFTTRRNVRAI
ncbi:hypothetical protein Y032_0067g87 [Ancylostoma ceylanicum]|uniref:Uncharacterized protein n=1 Tax=Ancylostoma ceylanicum TaxID=53326 RepID=A0A016U0Y3_9BILA|nr:hypothetical protein Y032_0067g87 [Ancylostoma ceylanicum]